MPPREYYLPKQTVRKLRAPCLNTVRPKSRPKSVSPLVDRSTIIGAPRVRIFSFVRRIARTQNHNHHQHRHRTRQRDRAQLRAHAPYIIIMYHTTAHASQDDALARCWPVPHTVAWPWKKKVSPCTQYLCNLITTIVARRSAKTAASLDRHSACDGLTSPIILYYTTYYMQVGSCRRVGKIDGKWSLLHQCGPHALCRANYRHLNGRIGFLIKTLKKSVVVEDGNLHECV